MDVVGWCFKRLSALQHNTVVSQDRQGPPLARDYFGDLLLFRSSRGWMQKWIRANPHIIEGRHARTHGRADTNQLYDSFLAGLYCVSYEKHHNRKVGSALNKLYNLNLFKRDQLYDPVGFGNMSHGIGAGANRKVDVPLCFCNTRAANVSRIGPGANNKAVVFVCFALFAFRALYSSHFASRPAME